MSLRYVIICGLMLSGAMLRADLTTRLVARWTFNRGADEEKVLTDDIGGLRLSRTAIGGDRAFQYDTKAGTVSLAGGVLLYCDAIRSVRSPYLNLKNAVTIWVRLKYIDFPELAPIFTVGLLNAVKPAGWEQMTLAAFYKPEGIGSYSMGPGAKNALSMGSGFLPVSRNEFNRIAVVFNGAKNELTLWVNGQSAVRKKKAYEALADFQALALGRLKEGVGQRMVVDELRVYDLAISPEWLDEIEPVK